jgi:hypothetical protein
MDTVKYIGHIYCLFGGIVFEGLSDLGDGLFRGVSVWVGAWT